MKKSLLPALLAALLLSCTVSKRMTYLEVPQEKSVGYEPVNIDSVLAKYSGYEGVFLNADRTIEHFGSKDLSVGQFLFGNLGSDWAFCDVEKYRYVVLNPEASWLTNVSFHSQPDKLYIVITDPDGTSNHYGLANLREGTEKGETVLRFIFPNIKRGSLVEVGTEYTYSIKAHMPPLDHDVALQFRIPCEKLSFCFAYPDWWMIQVKNNGPYSQVDYEKTFDEKNRKMVMRYSASDIPPIPTEPYSPYFKEVCKYLRFFVASLSMGGKSFDQNMTWKDITKATHDRIIATAKKGKGRFDIDNLGRKFSKSDTSQYAIVQSVVDYVRDSMEMTGRYGKTDYHKIVKQKKGGVMDLVGLTRAVLAKLKIPAEVLLIHSAEDGYLDPNYIYYTEYTIPAVRAEIDGKPYVLFPYGEKLPLGYVPPFLQGQQALRIGEDANWTSWTLPRPTREENTTKRDYRLTLGEDGEVTVEETGTLTGEWAYWLREEFAHLDNTRMEKVFKEWATFTGADVTLKNHEVKNLNDPDAPLIMKLSYDISNLLTVTPDEAVFHTGGLFAPISGSGVKFDPNNRQLPISIQADEQHEKSIEIVFPPSWRLSTELTDVSVENVFGTVRGQYSVGDDKLGVDQIVLLNQTFTEKDQYPQLLELVGNSSKLWVPNLVFSISDVTPQ